ncbi:MAG: hypothetical protein GEU81_08960 [Nitriliruptorales bacterium]|nr:hypothetical protein [Nitriliruptorales bacterium]
MTALASHAGRAAWRRLGARHPEIGRYGADVLAREAVRCGVILLLVLGFVGPLSLGADRLPVWVLAALATGGAATLPAGLVVELRALSESPPPAVAIDAPRGRWADPHAGWAAAVVVVSVAGLLAAFLAALAGTTSLWVALRWAATAMAGFVMGAGPRLVRRHRGQP